ncbi:unnamed protein product, partial [Meganyctiphanes norvegica]
YVQYSKIVLIVTLGMWHLVNAVVLAVVYSTVTCSGLKSTVDQAQFKSKSVYNSVYLDDEEKLLHVSHPKGELHVDWGLSLPDGIEGVECGNAELCVDYGIAKVTVNSHDHCQEVLWTTTELTELKDCILIEGHWYGGGEQISQPWPIEKVPRPETPFVTADMLQKRGQWYGGVSEAYWISSQGVAVRVEEETPLHLSVPDEDGDEVADKLCFAARHEPPFVASANTPLTLHYHICTAPDVRLVHERSYPLFFSYPSSFPDERMFQDPVWSTWAQYHTYVNDSRVLDFAHVIQDQGFNNSQSELSESWQCCINALQPRRFSNPVNCIFHINFEGFKNWLWRRILVGTNCSNFGMAQGDENFVSVQGGSVRVTKWWPGYVSSCVVSSQLCATERSSPAIRNVCGVTRWRLEAGGWALQTYRTFILNDTSRGSVYNKEDLQPSRKPTICNKIRGKVPKRSQSQSSFSIIFEINSLYGNSYSGSQIMIFLLHIFKIPDRARVLLGELLENNFFFLRSSIFDKKCPLNIFVFFLKYNLIKWKVIQKTSSLCQCIYKLTTG